MNPEKHWLLSLKVMTYVIEAARSLKGPQLKIGFTGEMKPFVIFSEGDDSVLQLVLPVKTYN